MKFCQLKWKTTESYLIEVALASSRKEIRIAAGRHIPRLDDPESVALSGSERESVGSSHHVFLVLRRPSSSGCLHHHLHPSQSLPPRNISSQKKMILLNGSHHRRGLLFIFSSALGVRERYRVNILASYLRFKDPLDRVEMPLRQPIHPAHNQDRIIPLRSSPF